MEEGGATLHPEALLMEIHMAAPELDDFVTWVATNEDFEDEELSTILSGVYSYARAKNDTGEEEDGDSEPSPDQS